MMSQVRAKHSETVRLRDALNLLEGVCGDLPAEENDKFLLRIAANLCERAAYNKAGHWSSSSVGDLLIIAAQIERFASPGRKLD